MRTLLRLFAGIFLLLLVGCIAVWLRINGMIKNAVISQSDAQLKVVTRLETVQLGLLAGTLKLDQLTLGSPAGFLAPQMLTIKQVNINTGGLTRLRSEPIHLASVEIDYPTLVVEQKGTKLNIKQLVDNINAQGGSAGADSSLDVRLIVDSLTITHGVVQLQGDLPGLKKQANVSIPEIDLKNLGNEDGQQQGVAMKDLTSVVISHLADQASKSAGIPIEVTGLLHGGINGVERNFGQAAQSQLNKLDLPGHPSQLIDQLGK